MKERNKFVLDRLREQLESILALGVLFEKSILETFILTINFLMHFLLTWAAISKIYNFAKVS